MSHGRIRKISGAVLKVYTAQLLWHSNFSWLTIQHQPSLPVCLVNCTARKC